MAARQAKAVDAQARQTALPAEGRVAAETVAAPWAAPREVWAEAIAMVSVAAVEVEAGAMAVVDWVTAERSAEEERAAVATAPAVTAQVAEVKWATEVDTMAMAVAPEEQAVMD